MSISREPLIVASAQGLAQDQTPCVIARPLTVMLRQATNPATLVTKQACGQPPQACLESVCAQTSRGLLRCLRVRNPLG